MIFNDLIKKRIVVFGANGMLGQEVVQYFAKSRYFEVLASSVEPASIIDYPQYQQCDITLRDDVKNVIYNFYPDIVINAAAYTNVDLSESQRELAWKINVKSIEYMAEAARNLDFHLIHISSDYVFDGKDGPYSETAKVNPLGYYGRTKLASENALNISGALYTIIRTNVLYGISNSRPDFVKWLILSLKENKSVNIVTDQINNPTFIPDLTEAIYNIVERKYFGIINIGGPEFLSRYDFALKIANFFNLNTGLINPIDTLSLNQTAKRPLKSGLKIDKAAEVINFMPHTIDDTLNIIKNSGL